MPLLEVQHLQKVYTSRFGGRQVEALQNVNFSVEPGEYVAIMGESGSGKTTLLNILAALDRPTAGEVFLNGKALSDVRERDLAAFRRSHLGFVFQDFNLLDIFSLRDNIFLPLVLAGRPYEEMERKLKPLAEQLGIADILLGVAVSVLKYLLILSALFSAFDKLNADYTLVGPRTVGQSKCYEPVLRLSEAVFPFLEWVGDRVPQRDE